MTSSSGRRSATRSRRRSRRSPTSAARTSLLPELRIRCSSTSWTSSPNSSIGSEGASRHLRPRHLLLHHQLLHHQLHRPETRSASNRARSPSCSRRPGPDRRRSSGAGVGRPARPGLLARSRPRGVHSPRPPRSRSIGSSPTTRSGRSSRATGRSGRRARPQCLQQPPHRRRCRLHLRRLHLRGHRRPQRRGPRPTQRTG